MRATHLAPLALAALAAPALAGSLSQQLADPEGWVVVQDEQHPDWGRVIARHKPLDGVDCLEISGLTGADPALLKAIILDIPGNLSWSSADLEASVVLSEDGATQDYFQHLSIPAPFADRYWFLRGVSVEAPEGPGSWSFEWERIDGLALYPDQAGRLLAEAGRAVEIGVNVGSWSLLPEGDLTRARFRSCSDVGGSIPRSAGEAAARLLLPNNLRDLFQEADRRAR
jgi:hypothetical protein